MQPEYNIQSATKVLDGITNPAAGAFYQAQDAYTMANHYMEKYARLSREAAEERLNKLNARVRDYNNTNKLKEATLSAANNSPVMYGIEDGQSAIKREKPRGRYNLLTGEEGYEYSDYTDY